MSCLRANLMWGELSWGELSLGRVVCNCQGEATISLCKQIKTM